MAVMPIPLLYKATMLTSLPIAATVSIRSTATLSPSAQSAGLYKSLTSPYPGSDARTISITSRYGHNFPST